MLQFRHFQKFLKSEKNYDYTNMHITRWFMIQSPSEVYHYSEVINSKSVYEFIQNM